MATADLIVKEIRALGRTVKALDHSFHRLVPMLSVALSTNSVPKENGRPRLSATARASLVLQGRYMGYMRQLKPREKARVRKIREAKGMSATIARAIGIGEGLTERAMVDFRLG